MQPSPIRLRVWIADQRLDLIGPCGEVIRQFPVSTSSRGVGFRAGSYRTPTGRFRIAEKIGADAPLGMVFKSRAPTGTLGTESMEEDLVLTRILWLDGMDPENANTKERYIYIHGTNHEKSIGTPASHGCIRMRNADIAELFEWAAVGMEVEILNTSSPAGACEI